MKSKKFSLENMKGDLFIALKLTIICFVAVLLLSVVHLLTYKKIEANIIKTINETNSMLVPEGKVFEKFYFYSKPNDKQHYYVVRNEENNLIGYTAVVLTSGYGGSMSMMVGFDTNLVIKNVKLLNNSETPGIGKNAEKPHYMDKFIGTNSKNKPIPVKKSMLNQQDNDAVTGATITYNGITKGLQLAVALLETEIKVTTNDETTD